MSKVDEMHLKEDDRHSPLDDYVDEVRTLFVSGLPSDVKQRELHLLFRSYTGFESAVLKFPQKPGKIYPIAPVAFVTFARKAHAQEAIDRLHGEKFDPDLPTTMRLEFAKSNTKNRLKSLKELNPSAIPMLSMGANFVDQLIMPADIGQVATAAPTANTGIQINSAGMPRGVKRRQTSSDYRSHPFSRPMELSSTLMSAYTPQYMTSPLLLQPQVYHATAAATAAASHPAQSVSPAVETKKIQVYVSNMSPTIKDAELAQLFQGYHGFSKARVTSSGCGLVEFTDQATAQFAISQLSQRVPYLGPNHGMLMQPVSADFCGALG